MRCSWTRTWRRLAAMAFLACPTMLWSAICHAQKAFDSAADPVYADGWQDGDNGGTGFTPWNFDAGYFFNGMLYAYAKAGIQAIDDGLRTTRPFSNPFNNVGRAWTIGTTPDDDGAPHIGRGFAPLQVGQQLNVLIDNPTVRQFFKGYFVRLNGDTLGADGNLCNNNNSCSDGGFALPMMNFSMFEYFSNGEWGISDSDFTQTGVFDTDTAEAGALFQVTRTSENAYDVAMNSLGGGADFAATDRFFANVNIPVDWIEFVFFNPPPESQPSNGPTDFYIGGMSIVPTTGVPGDTDDDGAVNLDDLNEVRNSFGSTGVPGVPGDAFPFDGKVDLDDLNLVRNNFGTVVGARTVPEPSALGMLLLGSGGILFGAARVRHSAPATQERPESYR